ncbi:hypothetical protein H0H92_015129 [Tricholoma furcatifolium]|nr:hypothetical protein H0H92_015129 [Tricholoma furcatifolium]
MDSEVSNSRRLPFSTEKVPQTNDFGFPPTPRRLRYNPDKPFRFGPLLYIAFGFSSTFIGRYSVRNPAGTDVRTVQISESFNVSYTEVSRIPTLLQAGYAVGLLFITPLGDLVRRRLLLLCTVTASASLTIGLAITKNLAIFEILSFFVGCTTVTPQILLPLAADVAAPGKESFAMSVVLSGLYLGILAARVLGGIVGQYAQWRAVYYLSVGVQYLVVLGIYFMIPDYPAKNKGMTYWGILRSMGKFVVTEPLVIQSCLINVLTMACYTNFWVTLTFLLGGPPYHYSTLGIGLFGFVGIIGIMGGPLVTHATSGLVPWWSSCIGIVASILTQAVQVGAGGINIAAVIITAFGIDVFRMALHVSISAAVFKISDDARARLNAILVISLFVGQVMGTAVGTDAFVKHGWRASAALGMGWFGLSLVILLLRGPHCERRTWFGYHGGLRCRNNTTGPLKPGAEPAEGGLGRGKVEKGIGRSSDVAVENTERCADD